MREAADRRLFAGLEWREELRDRVLSSLGREPSSAGCEPSPTGGEGRGAAPRRGPWASPWLGWGGLVVAGAAAVLILVLSGPLRNGPRLGSPGPATLSRAETGGGGVGPAGGSNAGPAGGGYLAPAGPPGAAARMGQAAEQGAAGPTLAAEARLETGGVAVALRIGNAPWDSPPPLEVAVIFPGVGERMGAVEGCQREDAGWKCRALVNNLPDQVRTAADLRVVVLLMQLPAEEGGAPAILAQARDVAVTR